MPVEESEMNKFEIGDRVFLIRNDKYVGTITEIIPNGRCVVHWDDNNVLLGDFCYNPSEIAYIGHFDFQERIRDRMT